MGLLLLHPLWPGSTPTPQQNGERRREPVGGSGAGCSLAPARWLLPARSPRVRSSPWGNPSLSFSFDLIALVEGGTGICECPRLLAGARGSSAMPAGSSQGLVAARAGAQHQSLLARPAPAHPACLPHTPAALVTGECCISNLIAYIHCLLKRCTQSAPGPQVTLCT